MYKRTLTLDFIPGESYFLFGPRGCGKTTWLKKNVPNAIYIDLLDFSFYQVLSVSPHKLSEYIPEHYNGWVIIDEVQRVPELLNEVHRLIESKEYDFILTGSSARSLRKAGVNLLAGRARSYKMHPLIYQECEKDFSLNDVLKYGFLPISFKSKSPQDYLNTYVDIYMREEVLQEGAIRNVVSFNKFLETASFSQGSIINYSEFARQTGISRNAVASYCDIVEDLLLAWRISPFAKRAKRRIVQHSKFYFVDVGIYRTLRPKGPLDTPEGIDGAALETLFLQSLVALNDYYKFKYKIHFWRTSNGVEIDFVCYGEKGLLAFEIKRAKNISTKMLKPLNSFAKDYPEAKLFMVHLGDHITYHKNIMALPFTKALQKLPEILSGEL